MELRPVGVVHSAVRQRKEMPAWGAPAVVEIFAEFEPALLRIEKHSHLWVLAWLTLPSPHRKGDERATLQVTPRGVTDPGPEGLHGVFAVRSPARPNPIGLTAARVLRQEGRRLHLDRLDFLDQTPVVDLKPYFITRDLLFCANGRQIGKPRTREDLRESLAIQAAQFHGALTPDVAVAVRIMEHYRAQRFELNDSPVEQLTVPLGRPQLIDGLMGITRATPGRGTLLFHDRPSVLFASGAAYLPAADLPESGEETLRLPDEALFSLLHE